MAKYEEFLAEIEEISDKSNLKDYHAFVCWFIEVILGKERHEVLNSICDGAHDKGIDAVIIDDIERNVIIIQSKFEHEGNRYQIKEAEIKLLVAVKNYFDSRRALGAAIEKGNQVTKRLLTDAYDAIVKKAYSRELIFITTHKKGPHIDGLVRDTYGFRQGEFSVFDYQEIMNLFTDKQRGFVPKLGPYHLGYKDADKNIIRTSTHKSWILTVPLEEIRNMVNKYRDQLFMKNVRNFLGDNRCNRRIQDTIKNDPDNFWYYNNGVSILCDDANIVVESGYIHVLNPQVVNGCQTVRSIEKFKGELRGDVIVRVIASKDHEFIDSITLYQNSSNPVKKRDLKSNDPVQVRLNREFKLRKYYYEVKRGESFREMAKKYPALKEKYANGRVVNNEEVAKVLAAIKLGPAMAVSEGSEAFFDNYYPRLFDNKVATFNCLSPWLLHRIIQNTYKSSKFHSFEKAYVFKNPGSFYVLRFIYDNIEKRNEWDKGLVALYENSDDMFGKFTKKFERRISKYFEIIYKTWRASKEPNYNTYFKSSSTISEMEKQYSRDIKKLNTQTKKIFREFGLS